MTFGTWHLAILFDLVQGIMLASQGKVPSPGNEGSMAVIVYVSIFPQFCLICVHMRISIILFVQFYVHAQRPCLRVHRETTGVLKEAVECQRGTSHTIGSPQCGLSGFGYCTWDWLLQGIKICVKEPYFAIFCGKLCRIGQDHAEPGEKQEHRSDRKWWKGYSRGRSW